MATTAAGPISKQNASVNTPPKSAQRQSDALQSWKEIASYLQRGVRTVQRWERFEGLPVRRPRPSERSPVFAFPAEIDLWLHQRATRGLAQRISGDIYEKFS